MKHIVIIVTLDTKSEEAAYLRERILELGHQALIIDVGCGGVPRMEADIPAVEVAGERGIPQVIAPSLVNVISRTRDTSAALTDEMRVRKYYFMDSLRILLWLTKDELRDIASVYADKLHKAVGPTKFLIPTRGWLNVETGRQRLLRAREHPGLCRRAQEEAEARSGDPGGVCQHRYRGVWPSCVVSFPRGDRQIGRPGPAGGPQCIS